MLYQSLKWTLKMQTVLQFLQFLCSDMNHSLQPAFILPLTTIYSYLQRRAKIKRDGYLIS